jgi:hypothetical protein
MCSNRLWGIFSKPQHFGSEVFAAFSVLPSLAIWVVVVVVVDGYKPLRLKPLSTFTSKEGGSKFLRNVSPHLTNDMTSRTWTMYSYFSYIFSFSILWIFFIPDFVLYLHHDYGQPLCISGLCVETNFGSQISQFCCRHSSHMFLIGVQHSN